MCGCCHHTLQPPPPPHSPQSGLPTYPVWSTSDGNGNGSPTGSAFIPAESDTYLTQNDQWFWKPGSVYRDLATLKQVYLSTVGANSKLLLNIAPDNTGRVPDDAVAIYTQFGQWIQQCYGPGVELMSTNGTGLSLALTLPYSTIIDRVVSARLAAARCKWAVQVGGEWRAGGRDSPPQLVHHRMQQWAGSGCWRPEVK